MSISLGGFYLEEGKRIQLPLFDMPKEEDIEELFTIIENKAAVLSMELKGNNDLGSSELTVYCENRSYLVMHGFYVDDGDYQVLTLQDNSSEGFKVVLGEKYPANAVIQDLSVVKNIFIYFLKERQPSPLLV